MKPLLITLLFVIVTFAGCKKKCVGRQQGVYQNYSYIGFDLLKPDGSDYFGFFGNGFDFTYTNVFDEKGKEIMASAIEAPWKKYNLSYSDPQDPAKPTGLGRSPLEIDYYNGETAYADSVGVEINRTFYLKLTKFDTDTLKVKYTLIDACEKTFGRIKVQFNDSTYFDGNVGSSTGYCNYRECYFKFRKK